MFAQALHLCAVATIERAEWLILKTAHAPIVPYPQPDLVATCAPIRHSVAPLGLAPTEILNMNGFLELNIAEQQLWVARPDFAAWSGMAARALTAEIDAVIAELMALRAGL